MGDLYCSSRLRDAVAALARRLLNSIVPWDDISVVVNRLIALDECPGVRPIAIGETLRRVLTRLCVMLLELMLNWLAALTNFVVILDLVLRVPFTL